MMPDWPAPATLRDRLFSCVRDLVSVNSVNPAFPGGPGEAAAARLVANRLREAGVASELQWIAPDRPNVVATIRGTSGGPSILLNAHLDTVGADGMPAPFTARREDDRLYGRGAYDMKGGAAIMLVLAEHFARHAPPGDLHLTFVADEEDRSLGSEHLLEEWLPRLEEVPAAAFVLEPTEEVIGIAHKGFAWFEIEVTGRAAHGSRPEEGVDAAFPLGVALRELSELSGSLARRDAHRLLGHATLHVGTMSAGSGWSLIPDRGRLGWERRTVPGEADVDSELLRIVDAVRSTPGAHAVKGARVFERPSYSIPADSLPVTMLRRVQPDLKTGGISFWADSALIGRHVPTVLFGPEGHGAHAADEWVSLNSLSRVADILLRVIASETDGT